ncbi:hypothetical protein A3D77_04345 [Candidatus Gottesmanbacteria bacterium RIFCSPHIGHO2_02_FULL_39_11]|uniref:Formyl transferase N-terminal domain-containing protein n=1 Tax=Candidatus Gottesmanbacteria bacterium RIFCSPHIGHO2_02_FULL_39_11 TaxID=1798382 RepID=A0A1F5ZJP2_9BACT|nr:MAG: hypothetical protein A3D77_04345 [Candidatus Gottesmanbacteria bacterium RIFCSPHIGHO2_02_FULL_39_11]
MSYKLINIGLIYYPSVRVIAYFNVFEKLGLVPSEIILMKGEIPHIEEIRKEDKKYDYSNTFFNVDLDIKKYFKNAGTKIFTIDGTGINDVSVKHALKKCRNKYFIFSGGGTLDGDFFNMDKEFIHVHPGLLPSFRGSTCFYYSLLADYSLASTGFIMEKKIDTGKILDYSRFRLNYKIAQSENFYMDYILDPYIRAVTLKKILLTFITYGEFHPKPQLHTDKPSYYVMHPILRCITMQKINKNYNRNSARGIIEI